MGAQGIATVGTCEIGEVRTAKEARAAMHALDAIESAVKAAGKVEGMLRNLVELEARTFRQIAEQGLGEKLAKADERYLARWIAEVTDKRLAGVIDACVKAGTTLRYMAGKARNADRENEYIRQLADKHEEALNSFRNNGSTDLGDVFRLRSNASYEVQLATDAGKNRCKDALLKMGGVCVGESVYVNVDRCSDKQLFSALNKRLHSIEGDIASICTLAGKLDERNRPLLLQAFQAHPQCRRLFSKEVNCIG